MSRRRLQQETGIHGSVWRAEAEAGVNLADAETVDDVKARRRELDVQRIERMRAQRKLLDLQIEKESGRLISAEQVAADLTRICSAFNARVYALADSLPGQVEGCDAQTISQALVRAFDGVFEELRSDLARMSEEARK
jgi:hypothetical protein